MLTRRFPIPYSSGSAHLIPAAVAGSVWIQGIFANGCFRGQISFRVSPS